MPSPIPLAIPMIIVMSTMSPSIPSIIHHSIFMLITITSWSWVFQYLVVYLIITEVGSDVPFFLYSLQRLTIQIHFWDVTIYTVCNALLSKFSLETLPNAVDLGLIIGVCNVYNTLKHFGKWHNEDECNGQMESNCLQTLHSAIFKLFRRLACNVSLSEFSPGTLPATALAMWHTSVSD